MRWVGGGEHEGGRWWREKRMNEWIDLKKRKGKEGRKEGRKM